MPLVLRRTLLLLLSTAVSLVAAELVLRAVGYGRITPAMNFGVNTRGALERGGCEPHATLFWTLPARPAPVDEAVRAVHPRRPVAPKGERRRLIVLGDSCSRISIESLPYSATLERLLGPRWEVLNAAVPGYTSHQGLAWLRLQLLDLGPDLVVVYFGWNDHWRATGLTDRDYERRQASGRPRLLALLDREPATPPLRVPLAEYAQNLEAMVAAIRARGAQVVLVAAPHDLDGEARQRLAATGYILPDEQPGPLHESYLAAVRRFAGRPGVAVLAADRLVAALADRAPLLMRDGIHLTDPAHAVLAAALAELITTGAGADGTLAPPLVAAGGAALAAVTAGTTEAAP